MKRMICFAAAVAIGSMGLVGCDRNNQANNTNPNNPNTPGQTTANGIQSAADKTGNALNNAAQNTGSALATATTRTADLAQNAGAKMIGTPTDDNVAPDASGIRDELSRVTDAAVTKDNFSSLVKDLSTDSQNRIGDFSKQDFADLNGIIAQIQGDWNAKYGHDFNEKSDALAVDNIMIRQGAAATGSNVPRGNETGIGTANASDNTGVVTLSLGGTDLTVPVIKQGILRDWYIDTPASLTGQKLHDNLSRELTAVKDAQATWPADENAAYRVVTAHVVAALMDQQAK